MFWGLIMEPKRRYMQEIKQSFHISMASLDLFASNNDKPCQVLLNYDDRNYLLCTLQKDKIIQCPLDLNFEAGDVIAFATNGDSNIHLTGYVLESDESILDPEEEREIEEKVETEGKRKKTLVEQTKNQPPKKKSKTEQLLDEVDEYDSNDDESFSLSKYLNEEEEGSEESEDSDAESDQEEVVEEASSADEDEIGGGDDDHEASSLSEDEEKEEQVQIKMNGKQKKQKNKIIEVEENNIRASTGFTKKTDQQASNKQKTPNKQDKTPKENKTPKTGVKSPVGQAQSPQKRTVEGGVIIQDIKVGDGPPAKSGKLLQVYYEGRLRHNNKLFDKLLQGPGFKFRLGKQEVIKGWDVGVNGMKVGGKRRIVCPPAMAYGEKGSPPQIPPNSSLVFEVELKAIK